MNNKRNILVAFLDYLKFIGALFGIPSSKQNSSQGRSSCTSSASPNAPCPSTPNEAAVVSPLPEKQEKVLDTLEADRRLCEDFKNDVSSKLKELTEQEHFVGQTLSFKYENLPSSINIEEMLLMRGQRLLEDSEYTASSTASSLEFMFKPQKEGKYYLFLSCVCGQCRLKFPLLVVDVSDPAEAEEQAWLEELNKIRVMNAGCAGNAVEKNFDFLKSVEKYRNLQLKSVSLSEDCLEVSLDESTKELVVKGVPSKAMTVSLVIDYTVNKASGASIGQKEVPLLDFKENPKNLWKNIPTNPDAKYFMPDTDSGFIPAGEVFPKNLVAASKRGRSHAHKGIFRDDNFKMEVLEDSGWCIVVVSDGAGSAEFSRKGSEIVCGSFVQKAKSLLERRDISFNMEVASRLLSGEITRDDLQSPELQTKFSAVQEAFPQATLRCLTAEPKEVLENYAKQIVWASGYQGYTDIFKEASSEKTEIKKYAATLLGLVMKRFGNEWLVASMNVGDGAIGLVDRDGFVTMLAHPDGGENVGETRFVTMASVWGLNKEMRLDQERLRTEQDNRLFIKWADDFKCLLSMTDGISDPKFGSDANLVNGAYWHALLDELEKNVSLDEKNESTAESLLNWLDFYEDGHHDDRTIAIVY